jgi:hypothetical protein
MTPPDKSAAPYPPVAARKRFIVTADEKPRAFLEL